MNKKKQRMIIQIAIIIGSLFLIAFGGLLFWWLVSEGTDPGLETLPAPTWGSSADPSDSEEVSETEGESSSEFVEVTLPETDPIETFPEAYEGNAVWISWNRRGEGEDVDAPRQHYLLYAADEGVLHPLRMYGEDIYEIVFHNPTEKEVTISFFIPAGVVMEYQENMPDTDETFPESTEAPSEEMTISEEATASSDTEESSEQEESMEETPEELLLPEIQYTVTLVPGAQGVLSLVSEKNQTVAYTIAVVGETSVAYAANQGQLAFVNSLALDGANTTIYMTGNMAGYTEEELYRLPWNCQLQWTKTDATGSFVAQHTNAATFNGENLLENYQMGGDPEVFFESLTLGYANNAWLSRNINYKKEGNRYTVYIPYEVHEANMYAAKLTYQYDGQVRFWGDGYLGSNTVDLTKTVYCELTSPEGSTHVYQLEGDRDKNNLPVVYITTDNGKNVTSKNTFITGSFSMDAEHVEGIDSIPMQSIQIKGRGHSTWKVDKKSYNLKFDEQVSILGLNDNRDWVLLANYFDPTLSRNYIAYEMAKKLSFDFTPSTYPVDVFFNGVYVGVYCIGDKIEIANGRVELDEDNPAADCDYLLEVNGYEYGYQYGKNAFSAGLLKAITIKHPDKDTVTPEQYQYISNYVAKANQAVVTLTNYEDYIDMESFIDWYIMTEFTYNTDSGFYRSVFITKKAGGKLEFQPVWDFDLSMGNICNLTPDYESWATTQNGYIEVTWGTYLLQDDHFLNLLEARWVEVRDQLLESSLQSIEVMREMLKYSGPKNFEMWVTVGEKLGWEWQFMAEYESMEEHFTFLENFFIKHYDFLNSALVDRIYVEPYIPKSTEETTEESTEETSEDTSADATGDETGEADTAESSTEETLPSEETTLSQETEVESPGLEQEENTTEAAA